MSEKTNKSKFISYFLGELSVTENEQIEFQCFQDDDFSAQLFSAEEDLIKIYLGGELSDSQKSNFQSNYLTTNARLNRVAIIKTLREKSPKHIDAANTAVKSNPSAVKTKPLFPLPVFHFAFTRNVLATGVIASLILLVGILATVIFVFHPSQEMPEIAQNGESGNFEQSPSSSQLSQSNSKMVENKRDSPKSRAINENPQKKIRPEVFIESNVNIEKNVKSDDKASNHRKSETVDNVKTQVKSANNFTLSEGILRDENSTEQILSPDSSKPVTNLRLILPNAQNYSTKNLRVELQNVEGAIIQSKTKFKIIKEGNRKIVSATFPTKVFLEKQYVISLLKTDSSTSIADYVFRVKKINAASKQIKSKFY